MAGFDARAFVELGSEILALRERLDAAAGDAPPTMLPGLGGSRMIRDCLEGRFRNDLAGDMEGECRLPIAGRSGGVHFGTVGKVAAVPRNLPSTAVLEGAAGAGLRFRVNAGVSVSVRLDWTRCREVRPRWPGSWRGVLMRRGAVAAQVFVVLSTVVACAGPTLRPHEPLEVFTAHLDQRIPRLMSRYGVPGLTIALIRGGDLVWSGAYGYTDHEVRREMSADAVFRVESISKPVTAWGVLRLVEQGRIELDAPVGRYLGTWELPASVYAEEEVTIRRLLAHNSGMPLGTVGPSAQFPPGSDLPPLREVLAREARLVRQPGSGFSYSDAGFNVLELVIEEVTGRDFAEFMADEVLEPLGMRRSSFSWSETMRSAIPAAYDLRGEPVPLYVYPARASGGLFASVEDVARFVSAGTTGSRTDARGVLEPANIRQLQSPEVRVPGVYGLVTDAYGLGYFVEQLADGRRAVWHGGQGNGWMSHFHAVPESGDAIVILTNSQRSWPLMGHVLRDWGRWSGVGSVKWGRLIYGVTALWVLVGFAMLASSAQVYRLVRGLAQGERRWGPLEMDPRAIRLVQAALGVVTVAVLAWSAAQPYLIVSSIFPGVAGWAGIALLVLAVVSIVSAFFPRNRLRPHASS